VITVCGILHPFVADNPRHFLCYTACEYQDLNGCATLQMEVVEMENGKRKTGIEVIGDVPWGTHLCQLYRTKKDLAEILVPYFEAGLRSNEYCMWVTSEPLGVEQAKRALRRSVRNLDDYLEKGQIEILDASEWYTKSGRFESERVLNGWVEKEKEALSRGFEGLRLTGNTFWLEDAEWRDFAEYESEVDRVIGNYRMLAICSYSLDRCGASEVIDVVNNHQCAIVLREGKWERIESAYRRRSERELRESRGKWRALVESVPDGIITVDREGTILFANRTMSGRTPEDVIGASIYSYIPHSNKDVAKRVLESVFKSGKSRRYEGVAVLPEVGEFWYEYSIAPVRSNGRVESAVYVIRDINQRKKAEEALREKSNEIQERVKELNCLYGISNLTTGKIVSLEDILKRAVELIPPAWQYPEITCARIIFNSQEFRTDKYKETKWKQNSEIVVHGVKVGTLEVAYLEDRPQSYEGPFLNEERVLINAIAQRLGGIIERIQAEEAMRVSESKLRDYLENALDGIYTIDSRGKFIYMNSAVASILGYSKEEMTGKSFVELGLVRRDYISKGMKVLKGIIGGERSRAEEFVLIRKDGSHVYVEISSFPIGRGDNTEIIAVMRDVTERKQTEEALRQSERYYHALLDSSVDFIIILNEDGSVRYESPSVQRMLGYTPEERIGKSAFEFVHSDDVENLTATFAKFLKNPGGTASVELRFLHRDGSYRVFEGAGRNLLNDPVIRGIIANVRDVTERKQAEEALRESEEKLRYMFESISDGVAVTNLEGVITEINSRALEMYGAGTKEEVLGKSAFEFIAPQERERALQNMQRTLE